MGNGQSARKANKQSFDFAQEQCAMGNVQWAMGKESQ
jgi:hypothetical protein